MKNSRSRCLPVASLLLGLALSSAARAEKPVHLFILSGQSNMERMNPEAGLMPEARALFPDAEVPCAKAAWSGRPIRLWVGEWNDIAKKHDLAVRIQGAGAADDGLHYTAEGYALLGRRYARQAKALIGGTQPAANGRPE